MTYDQLVTRLGTEINRTDIDTELQRFVQEAIDFLYAVTEWTNLEETETLTVAADAETVAVPDNFGHVEMVRFVTSGALFRDLIPVAPAAFAAKQETALSGALPMVVMLWNEVLYFYPKPTGQLSAVLFHRIGYTSIFEHTLVLTDDDNAASTGVAVYFDEDGGSNGEGKLLFVSPTTSDAIVEFEDADGHVHNLTISHDASAASNGVPWYFDEDASNVDDRNLFVSPTNADGYIRTGITNRHSHYLGFRDRDGAAGLGVQVYVDEDAALKNARLLFVSPGNAAGTTKVILSPDRQLPPFLERFQPVVRLLALASAWRWLKDFEAMGQVNQEALKMLEKIVPS